MTRGPTKRPLAVLQATVSVSTLDRFAMPPMLVAISHDLDSPLASIVHAAGLYYLVYGLCQPLWGIVSDRFGRVRTMRVTMLLAAIATIGSALTGSAAALGAARGLAGGLYGAAYPATLVYIGDTVPASERQKPIAQLMVGVAAGTAIASAGAGVLADVLSWRVAFWVTGLASLVVVWLLGSLPEPEVEGVRPAARQSIAAVLRSPVTLLVLVLGFAEGVVLLGCLTLLPAAVEETGASSTTAGLVVGVYGIGVFVFAVVVGRLARTWHPKRLIGLGGIAAGVGCAVLAWSQVAAVAIVVAVLIAIGWTWMHSSIQTWATEVLPPARATVMSFFAGSLFVGSAAGAGLVGGLADEGRYTAIFAAYAVLAVPLTLVAWWARGRWRRG